MQENDIVVYFGGNDGAGAPNTPTGYAGAATETGSSCDSTSAYKRMGATPDMSVSGLTSDSTCGHLAVVFRCVDTTTALDATTATAQSTTGDPNPPSITTVTANAFVVAFGALDDDVTTVSAPPSGYMIIQFGVSNQVQIGSAESGVTLMAAYIDAGAAGAEDPGAFTTAGDDNWSAHSVALRPA